MKFIISLLLTALIAYLYFYNEYQKKFYIDESFAKTKLINKKILVESLNPTNQKVNSLNIIFPNKELALEKNYEKIIFYRDNLKGKIISNIKDSKYILSSKISISFPIINAKSYLDILAKDNIYTSITKINFKDKNIYVELDLSFPYLNPSSQKNIKDNLLYKYDDLSRKLSYFSIKNQSFNYDDFLLVLDKKKQIEFIPNIIENKTINKKQQTTKKVSLKLELILLGNKKRVIINSKTLKLFDKIEDYTIIDIKEDKVLLKNDKEEICLEIKR